MLNIVIRMVVPMRREFGRSLDVQQFMHDLSYARTVLDEALTSRDPRLLEYAQTVQRHLYGARDNSQPLSAPPPAAAAAAAQAPAAPAPAAAADPAATPGEPTEAELRARMLKRYTSGLR